MSGTRKQPSRGNKGGGTSVVGRTAGEREEGGRVSGQRKGHGHGRGENSPQGSIIQREGGQTQPQPQTQTQTPSQTQTQTQPQTQGQRARRRSSRSQQQQQQQQQQQHLTTTTATTNTTTTTTTTTTTATTPSSKPPPSTASPTALPLPSLNPLPSTTPSTTTVKRTLDVAPPTVGPKGIMHDKMVHVSFHSVPDTPTPVPPSNRVTRAQKREERQHHQRNSHPMDSDDTDSDSSSPRVRGLFDAPLLPPRKPRRKPRPPTAAASTRNPPDALPSSLPSLPTSMDLDSKSSLPPQPQHPPSTPLSAQPLPSAGHLPASSYWTQPWSGYGHGNTNPTTSSVDTTGSTPNIPTPHTAPSTLFTSFPPQVQGWPHVGGINVTPIGWTNPANATESPSGPNVSFNQFPRVSQPSPSIHDTSPTLVHQSTPQLQNPSHPQTDTDGFVDPGPWYPWKADKTWYEPHRTNPYYRLHEKWFPGAPTLATHPDGLNGGTIYDDGKSYPPSMFVEGRPDLEYFGMGVDPPDRMYDFVGTVATARHFHFDDSRAGFDQTAKDELDKVGRPLPFITVFEDEMVALVEEFLWRRRRARWLGRPIPSLDPPPERYRHSSSPTAAPKPVTYALSSAMSAWNTEAEPAGESGEHGYAEGGGSAPVPGQTPQSYYSGQPMDYEYPRQGPTQPKPNQQHFQTSPSQQNQAQRVPMAEGGGLGDLNKPTQSPPPGQAPWASSIANVLQSSNKPSDGTLITVLNPPGAQVIGSGQWNASNGGYPGINHSSNGLGVGAAGHGHSQIPPGSAVPITPQGWPTHANVGVISGPPIGHRGATAGPKITPPAVYGDPGRPSGGSSVPFGTDIAETEDYPGGAVYSALAGQQLQRQQARQPLPQQQQQQPSRQGSVSIVPPPNQFQRPAPPQRVGSGSQYLPTTPGLHPPQHGGQNANSPYQPPFENSWLDPVIAQHQAATNQQPPAPPGQQRSQSQPTSPPFAGHNFSGLNLPPAPNLNGHYMGNGVHHPQFAAAVPGAPGAHPPQFYPTDPAFGGQFGVAQQSFAHH